MSTDHARIDPEVLARYLAKRWSVSSVSVSGLMRFSVGASRETWSFDATRAEPGAGQTAQGFILRRDADGGPIDVDLEHEFLVYRALVATPVPVPQVHWYEPDPTVAGRPFYLMARVDGCESSPGVVLGPGFAVAHRRLGDRFIEIIAALHTLDVGAPEFAFLDRPTRETAASAQLDYWGGLLDGIRLGPQPLARGILAWLWKHLPPPAQRLSLLHGDPRTGNYLADASGEIHALLDWELSHVGDPLEDLGYALMKTWHFGSDGLVSGLVPRDEFLARYSALTGIAVDPEALRFWEVFNNFKAVMIQLTGAQAFADGRTASMMMLQFSRGARRFAIAALEGLDVPGLDP